MNGGGKAEAQAPESKPILYLHCKCNSCTSWELEYDPNTYQFYLACASCSIKIPVSIDIGNEPHASLHWEE